MKKIFSLLLILTLITTMVYADGEIFVEDMESYSEEITPITITIDDNTTKQLGTTDWWMIKGASGNPLSAGNGVFPTLSVVKDGDNTALEMTGGSGDYSSYITRRQATRYMGTGLAGMSNDYKIEVDYRKMQTRATLCFQFMVHNNGKDYYIVNIAGEKTGGAPMFSVAKVVNNELVNDVIVHSSNTYTSVTSTSGGGLTGSGKISIVSDGEGVIKVTVSGKRYPNFDYNETITLVDNSPFEIDAKNTTVGFFMGTTQTSSRIDNIIVTDVEKYVDYEPGTALYLDVSDKTAVSEFDESRVLRIVSPSLAGETVDVTFNSESGDVVKSAEFDENGMWVNLVNQEMCTGITLPDGYDYSDLMIFAEAGTDTEKIMAVKSTQVHYYPRLRGVIDNSEYTWTSSDESVATVSDGAVTGVHAGTATITAEYAGASLSFDVTVKGEFDAAQEQGKLDEYFAAKKPIFDEINNALTNDDAAKLTAVLTNSGDIKISDVLDINMEMLDGVSEEDVGKLVANLITYEPFSFTNMEDFVKFENAIKLELDVIKLENVADATEFETLLLNNDLLKLDVENKFFLRYKEQCIANLLNIEHDNYNALKKHFDENWVMTSYKEMISSADIGDLCDNSSEIIKYNKSNYKKEKGTAMYKSLIDNKDSINDIADLKKYIDEYKKPVSPGPSGGGSSGGGGGSSGGGGGSINTPVYTVDETYAEKAEESVSEQASTENVPVYFDVEKDAWYEQYILKLAGKNIMNGNDGYIKPNDNVTRAEFVKMLVLASGIAPSEEDACNFADVKPGDWYYQYVAIGHTNSIVLGSNGQFLPNSYISREEIAVFIDRVINNLDINVKSALRDKLFNDDSNISEWAYAPVIRCASYGIIGGYEDNTFVPQGYATRAESAKMITCLMDMIEASSAVSTEAK